MSCSKEEIERKRIMALQKRHNKILGNSPGNFIHGRPQSGQMKSNSPKSFHPYTRKNIGTENNVPVSKVVNGTVYLISESRFEVNPSEFCMPLINVFKSISSKCYDASTKLWNFSIDDYQEFTGKVAPLAPHVVLGTIPNFVLKILREHMNDPSSVDLTPIEATLRHKLMPFQEEGVRFGIVRQGRCMIADDMGLGKTFQALAIASYYRHDWPLLIVTTSSMRETWQSKIHELLPSVPMMNIVTLTGAKDAALVSDKQTEIVIVSYKVTTMHEDVLKNKNFGAVIIDESHNLKSHKAQCTVSLQRVCRGARRVLLLSGTPALSRPAELYTQLALLARDNLPHYTQYGMRYCDGKKTNFGWDMSGQSNLTELQIILQKQFLIRRTKEQVLNTLQEKTRESVILDSSLLEYNKHDEYELTKMAETYKSSKTSDRHAALLKFFSETARVKIPAVCKYIKQLLAENKTDKFLVFAHHKNVVEAICLTLDEAAVNYICIIGSTPTVSRADLVDKFQHSDSCRCAVLSITAAGAGLTLTAARLVLFAELHWNPGILTQAESRAHRLGQSGAVCVRYLLASRTADDCMWPLLNRKLQVLNDVGLSKDSFEDTATRHQESKNNIMHYLSPVNSPKNRNDYIPGTNIRRDSINRNAGTTEAQTSKMTATPQIDDMCQDEFEKSFLEDDEDDEMLANMDL